MLKGFEMPSLLSVEVPINLANRVWNIPPDFIALSRVAYREGKRLWDLTVDNTLDLSIDIGACESPTQPTTQGTSFAADYWIWGTTRYGEGGGKNVNYYRVDLAKNRIVFSESYPQNHCVIEYLSAGKGTCKDTFVPLAYVAAMKAFVEWKVYEYSGDDRVYARAKDKERQYKELLWDSNILSKSPTTRELLDELYKASSINYR